MCRVLLIVNMLSRFMKAESLPLLSLFLVPTTKAENLSSLTSWILQMKNRELVKQRLLERVPRHHNFRIIFHVIKLTHRLPGKVGKCQKYQKNDKIKRSIHVGKTCSDPTCTPLKSNEYKCFSL